MDETKQKYVYYRFPCNGCVVMVNDDLRAWILQVCEDRKADITDEKGEPIQLPTETSRGMAIMVLGLMARSAERITELGRFAAVDDALAAVQEKLEAELKVDWVGELGKLVDGVEIVGKEDSDDQGIQGGVGATENSEETADEKHGQSV